MIIVAVSHRRLARAARVLATGAVLALLTARADSVKMPNGETLHGTIVHEAADHVVFRSASFGEMKLARAPGMTLVREAAPAPTPTPAVPVVASVPPAAPASAAGAVPGGAGRPAPSALKTLLGLSDRWSLEVEGNLLVQNDKFHLKARGLEGTIGYRVPNPAKPTQPLHEFGLFGAHTFQQIDDTVVAESTEVAVRYFYQPLSRWLLVSQADWMEDRINGVASRSRILAIPSYRLVDRPGTRLLAGIGPSYLIDTRLVPTGPGTTREQSDHDFRVGFYQLFHHAFNPALTFRQTLIVLADTADASTYNLRFNASLRRQLSAHLSLSLAYDYVRDENPMFALESIGTLKLMLGYQF